MKSGDILYFWGEEQVLMVVMANDKGVRLYDIDDPEFTDEGDIITRYVSYSELEEVCSYMGNAGEFIPSSQS